MVNFYTKRIILENSFENLKQKERRSLKNNGQLFLLKNDGIYVYIYCLVDLQ